MSQDKEILKKLFAAVAKQQQAITKLAQAVGAPTAPAPGGVSKAQVEADILDMVYGKALPQFKDKIRVHYAKKAPAAAGGENLVVGLFVPENVATKWQSMQNSIQLALKNKYGVAGVVFKTLVKRYIF